MRSLTNQPFADSPSPRNRCRIAGWTDFWESAGLGIKTAALPAAALLSWVFCITQIRVGRAQVPLSACLAASSRLGCHCSARGA